MDQKERITMGAVISAAAHQRTKDAKCNGIPIALLVDVIMEEPEDRSVGMSGTEIQVPRLKGREVGIFTSKNARVSRFEQGLFVLSRQEGL